MIREVKARFIAVRVKLDSQDHPERRFRQELFDSKGLPTVGLVDSHGTPVVGQTIGKDLSVGDVTAARFIEILRGVK